MEWVQILTDEQADEAIDKFLAEEQNSFEDLVLEIMRSMQEAGFFQKGLDLKGIKEEAVKEAEKAMEATQDKPKK